MNLDKLFPGLRLIFFISLTFRKISVSEILRITKIKLQSWKYSTESPGIYFAVKHPTFIKPNVPTVIFNVVMTRYKQFFSQLNGDRTNRDFPFNVNIILTFKTTLTQILCFF